MRNKVRQMQKGKYLTVLCRCDEGGEGSRKSGGGAEGEMRAICMLKRGGGEKWRCRMKR